MSLNGSLGLGVVLTAQDLASGAIDVFGKNLQNTASKAQQAASSVSSGMKTIGMVTLAAGAALAGGLSHMATISGEFEEAIAAVGAVSGASAVELKALTNAAIGAGIATQFSPKQAAVGLGDLAQAGYSANESIELLRPVLDLAAGSLGKLTPSGAAGLAAQTLKAFQIDVKDASITVDKLLQSVNAFALSGEELPLALGTASRGAQVMKQSLDETLISLGLVKNIIPSVERASTAVAVSMERMVGTKHLAQIEALGVKVADANGKFRPFLDIMTDMQGPLDKMTDKKRAGWLEHTFGAEALGGIQAIMTQLTGGIKTQTGEVVKGAAAVAYLREQFANAGGTAKTFADKLLDTYEGQKKLVKGSLETLAILAGDPLRKALRPIVESFLAGVNKVIAIVQAMPEGTKTAIAKVALALAVILPVAGVLLIVGGAVVAFVAKLVAMGSTLGYVVLAMGPLGAAIGVVVAAFSALHVAYESDLGGFGSFVRETVREAGVAWRGLVQVFSQGGFSGAVRDELNSAENKGVKEFVIGIYTWVGRLKSFLSGFGDGFSGFVKSAEPVISEFTSALREAGTAIFGITENGIDHGGTLSKWQQFGDIGRQVGEVIGRIAVFAVRAATAMVRIGVAAGEFAGPFMSEIGGVIGSVKDLYGELMQIGIEMGLLDNTASGTGTGLANIFRTVAGVVLGFLGMARQAWSTVSHLGRGLISVVGGLIEMFTGDFSGGMKRVIYGVMTLLTQSVLGMIGMVAGGLDVLLSLIPGWDNKLGKAVEGWKNGLDETLRTSIGIESPEEKRKRTAEDARAKAVADAQNIYRVDNTPGVAQMEGSRSYEGGMSTDELAGAMMSVAERPVQVSVPIQVMTPDGDVLASMVAEAQSSGRVRSGTPG